MNNHNCVRAIAGYSRYTNSEHYIVEFLNTDNTLYRHQYFIDNNTNKAYHISDNQQGVDERYVIRCRYLVLLYVHHL